MAKKKLRALRQEAREGTKLLEDKKVLEQKVHELQAMLETVQNQRNELRQQVGHTQSKLAKQNMRFPDTP